MLGKKPTQLAADAGYCSDANLAGDGGTRDRRLYRAGAGRAGEGGRRRRPRRRRARNQGRRALQPLPLQERLPEPVFGQIKQARGFRQFLLRGVEKVANSGASYLAHNI